MQGDSGYRLSQVSVSVAPIVAAAPIIIVIVIVAAAAAGALLSSGNSNVSLVSTFSEIKILRSFSRNVSNDLHRKRQNDKSLAQFERQFSLSDSDCDCDCDCDRVAFCRREQLTHTGTHTDWRCDELTDWRTRALDLGHVLLAATAAQLRL